MPAVKQGSPDLGNALVETRSAVQYLYSLFRGHPMCLDSKICKLAHAAGRSERIPAASPAIAGSRLDPGQGRRPRVLTTSEQSAEQRQFPLFASGC